jgi:hypothetical protein
MYLLTCQNERNKVDFAHNTPFGFGENNGFGNMRVFVEQIITKKKSFLV